MKGKPRKKQEPVFLEALDDITGQHVEEDKLSKSALLNPFFIPVLDTGLAGPEFNIQGEACKIPVSNMHIQYKFYVRKW